MLKILLGFLGIIILLAVIGVLMLANVIRRGIKIMRKAASGEIDDEEFQRMSNKYYRGKEEQPEFDKDYFKGSGRPGGGGSQQPGGKRTVHTPSGVTIIDHRNPETAGRKIFTRDDGEYVDFTEEQ